MSSFYGTGRRKGARYGDPFSSDTVSEIKELNETLKQTNNILRQIARAANIVIKESESMQKSYSKIRDDAEGIQQNLKGAAVTTQLFITLLSKAGNRLSSMDGFIGKLGKGMQDFSFIIGKTYPVIDEVASSIFRLYSQIEYENHRLSVEYQKTTNATMDQYLRHYKSGVNTIRKLNDDLNRPVFSTTDYFQAASSLAYAGISNLETVGKLTETHLIMSRSIDGWTTRYGALLGKMSESYGLDNQRIEEMGDAINSLGELNGILTSDLIEIFDSYSASIQAISKSTGENFEKISKDLMGAASVFGQMFVDSGRVLGNLKSLYQAPMAEWNKDVYAALSYLSMDIGEFRETLNNPSDSGYTDLALQIVDSIRNSPALQDQSSEQFKIAANKIASGLQISYDEVLDIINSDKSTEELANNVEKQISKQDSMRDELKNARLTLDEMLINMLSTNRLLTSINAIMLSRGLAGVSDIPLVSKILGKVFDIFNKATAKNVIDIGWNDIGGFAGPNIPLNPSGLLGGGGPTPLLPAPAASSIIPSNVIDADFTVISESLVPALNNNTTALAKVGSTGGALSKIGGSISTTLSKIGSIFNKLIPFAGIIISALQMFSSKTDDSKAGAIMGIAGAIVGTVVGPAGTAIGGIIGMAIGKVLSSFMSDEMKKSLGGVVDSIVNPIKRIFSFIKENISVIWGFLKSVLTAISDIVGAVVQLVGGIVGEAMNLINPIIDFFEKVRGVVTELLDPIKSLFGGIANFVKGSVSGVLGVVKGFFKPLMFVIQVLFKILEGIILNPLKKLFGVIGWIFRGIGDIFSWIGDKFSEIGSWVSGLFDKLVNGFKNMYNNLSNIINKITFGLIDIGTFDLNESSDDKEEEESSYAKNYISNADYFADSAKFIANAIYTIGDEIVDAVNSNRVNINIPVEEDDGRVVYDSKNAGVGKSTFAYTSR